jgi:hypothetical protein
VRPWLLIAIAVAATIATIATIAIWFVDVDLGRGSSGIIVMGVSSATSSRWAVTGTVASGLVLAALICGVMLTIARRPQAPKSPSIDAVQHAIRSSALLSLAGAALLSVASVATLPVARLANALTDDPAPIGTALGAVSGLLWVAGFAGVMLSLRSVPRTFPLRPHPTIVSDGLASDLA